MTIIQKVKDFSKLSLKELTDSLINHKIVLKKHEEAKNMCFIAFEESKVNPDPNYDEFQDAFEEL